MRIGIDCRLWSETGVGRYTRNLVRELEEIDKVNEYTLFVLSKDAEAIKFEIRNSKFEITIVDIRWHTVKEQLEFPSIIEKENLDLMHFPYFSVPLFYTRQFVVTIHDLIINHFPTGQASTLPYPLYWLKLQGYKYVISQAAKRARKVLAVSKATKDEIVKHMKIPPSNVVITYEGVENALKASSSKHTAPPSLGSYFLYVGNAYPHKNLDRLLDAFSLVREEHKDLSLVLVGRDDFFYRRLKEADRDTKGVIFKNVTNDEELAAYYKHAQALIMPSLMEGFGLPPLEAMANHCLVLASAIPSLKEVCADSAIYFDPKNVSEIAEKMNEVLSLAGKEKEALLMRGKKRTRQFSWRKMAEETILVYNSCVPAHFV